MKNTAFRLAASLLCGACLSFAIASPVRAAADGINRLVATTQLKASNANDEAMLGADKQRQLIEEKKPHAETEGELGSAVAIKGNLGMKQKSWNPANFAQPEGAVSPADPLVSHANQVVADVEAIAAFEKTASADGIDDAERSRLGELVGVAGRHLDAAISGASAAMASAKKQLAAATDADDKARCKLQLESSRKTLRAHRRTAAALKTLAKRLAA